MRDKYHINLLPYTDIIKYCKKYFKTNNKPKRGKPKVYEDYLILAIGIIMQMYNYSFREVIVILERELKRRLPSLSTLHYRLSQLDNKLLEKIILKISKEIIKKKLIEKNTPSVTAILITDATGFSYSNKFYANFKRGLEIRKIKSHIKTQAIGICIPELNLRLPLSISNFEAYYDERKALKEILNSELFSDLKSFLLENFSFESFENKIPLLGDAMYSNSNELIDLSFENGLLPIFKIKKPLHNDIKSPQRKKVKEIYDKYKNSIFRQRFNIEGIFGNVKNKFNCYVNAVTFKVAKNLVYMKFLAYLFVIFFIFFTFTYFTLIF